MIEDLLLTHKLGGNLGPAYMLCDYAHEGQQREDGSPYSSHPRAVCDQVTGFVRKVVALLHDAVEDNVGARRQEIRDRIMNTFDEQVLRKVEILTRWEGEFYYDFIMRIIHSEDQDCIEVKIQDITHNLSDAKPGSRTDKYRLARHLLIEAAARIYVKSIP